MSEGRRLGRGLEALLGPISKEQAQAEGALRDLPLGAVRANPYQPRTRFDENALAELVSSIDASGLLQPVVVRPKDGAYELIAGERRLRAVQQLGWKTIPAVVKEVDDRTLLTLALIENLQRHDLSAIDEALGYKRLMEDFGVTQTEVARLVGKSRSAVANLLRLLDLPEPVRAMVHRGDLTEGHARALLGLESADAIIAMATRAHAEGWSVRDTEAAVRGEREPLVARGNGAGGPTQRATAPAPREPADVRRVEDALRRRLGTDVKVVTKKAGRGSLTIAFYSNDDLARLLELVLGEPYRG
ncbi:MAG: ParB/RepB/Spo0J family partition protein [Gemmatimonadota bacterium]|nr:ParB/RepB/Spo0J family partition protein [Gemmatimonadota bacterium]